jgi:hypothetical protein
MTSAKLKALLFADIAWFFGEGMLGPLFAVFTERVGAVILLLPILREDKK